MMCLRVLSPGLMTTVQDEGRFGYLDYGVPREGALDLFSASLANTLVGNASGEAVLELTITGPRMEMLSDADIALTGADMEMTVNGERAEPWRSLRVTRGDIIRISRAMHGCRSYLAVTGGFDVPVVMGSRSTYLKGRIGGIEGRALVKGDELKRGEGPLLAGMRHVVPREARPAFPSRVTLRTIPGPQDDAFSSSLDIFFSSSYEVTPASDRMGCRLRGPALRHDHGVAESIISEPIVPGSVQVPADGQPIILLMGQTAGGYAKVATIISADIPKVAQIRPGDTVRFKSVGLEEAHVAFRDYMTRWNDLVTRISRSP